ncbi:hypothetical protein pb186bvf_016509 [Paramecium bursaria]
MQTKPPNIKKYLTIISITAHITYILKFNILPFTFQTWFIFCITN